MKLKRFFALAGVILLVVMYASTLIFSLMEGALAATLFKASVFCTLIIPVFLYMYTMFFKYFRNKNEEIKADMDAEAAKTDAGSSSKADASLTSKNK